jgi:hypothetical protein
MLTKLRIEQRQPARAKKNRVTVEFRDVKSFCEAVMALAEDNRLKWSGDDESCGIVATVRFPDDDEEGES